MDFLLPGFAFQLVCVSIMFGVDAGIIIKSINIFSSINLHRDPVPGWDPAWTWSGTQTRTGKRTGTRDPGGVPRPGQSRTRRGLSRGLRVAPIPIQDSTHMNHDIFLATCCSLAFLCMRFLTAYAASAREVSHVKNQHWMVTGTARGHRFSTRSREGPTNIPEGPTYSRPLIGPYRPPYFFKNPSCTLCLPSAIQQIPNTTIVCFQKTPWLL